MKLEDLEKVADVNSKLNSNYSEKRLPVIRIKRNKVKYFFMLHLSLNILRKV